MKCEVFGTRNNLLLPSRYCRLRHNMKMYQCHNARLPTHIGMRIKVKKSWRGKKSPTTPHPKLTSYNYDTKTLQVKYFQVIKSLVIVAQDALFLILLIVLEQQRIAHSSMEAHGSMDPPNSYLFGFSLRLGARRTPLLLNCFMCYIYFSLHFKVLVNRY